MEVENEEKSDEEDEKNDENSTVDEEINLINELKDISEKSNIKYDLVFRLNHWLKKRGFCGGVVFKKNIIMEQKQFILYIIQIR